MIQRSFRGGRLLIGMAILCALVLGISPTGNSAAEEPADGSADSIIFGNVIFACCGTGNATYQILMRNIETGKNYAIKLTPRGDDKGYSFVKPVPAGHYYLSRLIAPKVEWENKLFDKNNPIEVISGGNTYIGDWTFKLYVSETKYDVEYKLESVSEFALINPSAVKESYFVAAVGKPAIPLRQK